MSCDMDDYPDGYERQLKITLRTLIERMNAAREGSAEHRLIERQLEGVRGESELAGLIMEGYDCSGVIDL
jgi:hypothetical protein